MTKIKNYGDQVLELINGFIDSNDVRLECTFDEIVEQDQGGQDGEASGAMDVMESYQPDDGHDTQYDDAGDAGFGDGGGGFGGGDDYEGSDFEDDPWS